MLTSLGINQAALHGCTDFDFTSLGHQVSCHINDSNLVFEAMLVQNLTRKYDQLIAYAL
jgi:hypothetical protein